LSDTKKQKALAPFALSLGILAADQASKLAVLERIRPGDIAWTAFGDFFWLVHHKNLGAAFSMGDGMPSLMRAIVLIIMPLALMLGLIAYYFKTDEFSPVQRWSVGCIVGGGLGNLIDRIWRPEGVVDFLSFKFYGLFGLERWPTFNIADMAIVAGGLLILLSLFLPGGYGAAKGDGPADGEPSAGHARRKRGPRR
jgi:signal peptidase II